MAQPKQSRRRRSLRVPGYLGLAVVAITLPMVLAREHIEGYEHLVWIAAWSVLTLVAYAIDKRAARAGAWRIEELTLHLFALLGGFVGGWIGRHALRHKTRKPVFGIVLVVATVVHAVAALYTAGVGPRLW